MIRHTSKYYIMIFSLLLLLITSFTTESTVPISLDENFVLTTSDAATWKEGNVSLEILKVMDSRCPENTNCIWAGELSVELKILSDGKEEIKILTVPAVGSRSVKSQFTLGENTLHFLGQPGNKLNKAVASKDQPISYEFIIKSKTSDSIE